MAVKYLSDRNPDGTVLGYDEDDLVGFYGADPVAQPAASAYPAVATTAAINSSISASCFGFTSAQATAIVTLVNGLRAHLVTLGLIST